MVMFKIRYLWIACISGIICVALPFVKGADKAIVLGPIEGELARKQIPIDLGRTPKVLVPLISKPIFVHGGLSEDLVEKYTIGEINNAEKPIVSVTAQRNVAFPVVRSARNVALGILLPSSLNSTILFATCNP